jgi:hypothetical protein
MALATTAHHKLVVVVGLLAAMLLAAPHTANAISCDDVADAFAPCLSYDDDDGEAPMPSTECCEGIHGIADATQSTADKRAACSCLKNLLTMVSGMEPEEVARIPSQCQVNLPFAISATADCSRVTLINVA